MHERFLTDTARFADVVLPATSSLEHSDLYRAYGQYVVQRAQAALPPVGEAKANWDAFALLARAMGLDDPFFRLSADDLVDRLLAKPAPMREGLDGAALDAGRAVKLTVRPGAKARFRTPSGKIEILRASDGRRGRRCDGECAHVATTHGPRRRQHRLRQRRRGPAGRLTITTNSAHDV